MVLDRQVRGIKMEKNNNLHMELATYIRLMNDAEKYGTVKPVLSSNGIETVTYEDARKTLNTLLSDMYSIQVIKDDKLRIKLYALINLLSDRGVINTEDITKLSDVYDKIDIDEFDE